MLPEVRSNSTAWIFLALAGVLMAYAIVFAATPIAQAHGDARNQQLIGILAAGVLGLLYWLVIARARRLRSHGGRLHLLVLILPLYAILQTAPLPYWVLRILSPGRGRMLDSLGGVMARPSWAPLSAVPAATLYHCLVFAACAAIFGIAFDLCGRLTSHPWAVLSPLLILGAGEAALGILQVALRPDSPADGTFAIRNHYAGFLEMVLPFALLLPVSVLHRAAEEKPAGAGPIFKAGFGFAVAALILFAIVLSLSRMGFVTAVASLMFMSLVALIRGRGRWRYWRVVAALAIIPLLAFVVLPPARLILRFADMHDDVRSSLWSESFRLAAAYPIFGCGLGAFQSALLEYKTANAVFDIDYAHNDYLQYLAELGFAGFALCLAPVVLILVRLPAAWERRFRPETGWLVLACAAAAVAMALHSIVDFNLYVPANMFVTAWLLGVAAHAGVSERRSARRSATAVS